MPHVSKGSEEAFGICQAENFCSKGGILFCFWVFILLCSISCPAKFTGKNHYFPFFPLLPLIFFAPSQNSDRVQ